MLLATIPAQGRTVGSQTITEKVDSVPSYETYDDTPQSDLIPATDEGPEMPPDPIEPDEPADDEPKYMCDGCSVKQPKKADEIPEDYETINPPSSDTRATGANLGPTMSWTSKFSEENGGYSENRDYPVNSIRCS